MTTPNIEGLMRMVDTYADRLHLERVRHCVETAYDRGQSRGMLYRALQSQAERIAYLEADRNLEKKMRKDADEYAETLRAQLEPVAHQFQTADGGWHPLLTDKHYQDTKADGRWPIRELFTRPMPAQDVTELVEALEQLARLGNGEHYGNSDGNMIARTALSKYKGAK